MKEEDLEDKVFVLSEMREVTREEAQKPKEVETGAYLLVPFAVGFLAVAGYATYLYINNLIN